jgi:hypothetical protein
MTIPQASYALNKVLTAVAREHKMTDRLTDADLAGHTVTTDERAALMNGDIDKLYELGANPYLIRRIFRSRFKI